MSLAVKLHIQATDAGQAIARKRLVPRDGRIRLPHPRLVEVANLGDGRRIDSAPTIDPIALIGHHHEPTDIEQYITNPGDLPIDHAGQLAVLVEDIPGLVVAVIEPYGRAARHGLQQQGFDRFRLLDPLRLRRLQINLAPARDLFVQGLRCLPVRELALPIELMEARQHLDCVTP